MQNASRITTCLSFKLYARLSAMYADTIHTTGTVWPSARRPRAIAAATHTADAESAEVTLSSPAAIGRKRLVGCLRSDSTSSTSFTR